MKVGYCASVPHMANWAAVGHADSAALERGIRDLADQSPITTPGVTASGPQCTTDELSAALAPDRSSDQGTDWAIIEVTNSGDRSCEIGPDASLSWFDAKGETGKKVSTAVTQNDPAALAPGESAGVVIGLRQAALTEADCHPSDLQWMRIEMADGRHHVIAGGTVMSQLLVDVSALGIKACTGDAGQLTVFGPMVGASLHD
jgi:hypothetical protein